ncbi:hypothetical protein [Bacillus thuringiensis]|uniref:hypothetical protein n=1 Tax=Bacillus thuringiensis TaxID=1428 RepID=UPI000BFC6D82|nr:hypothetical protein [Bacillus thuringiensis]PGM50833.1 hypothetical protein CN949_16210 [Bacillus thuringiensis]
MKRHELLEKAFKGEIKTGDKFTDGTNEIVFNGGDFRHTDDGTRLWLAISNRNWKPVPKTITVELTEEEIRTIRKAMVVAHDRDIEVHSSGKPFASTWTILNKAGDMLQELTGGRE